MTRRGGEEEGGRKGEREMYTKERIEQRKEKITKLNAEKAKEQEKLQQDRAVLKRKKELTA